MARFDFPTESGDATLHLAFDDEHMEGISMKSKLTVVLVAIAAIVVVLVSVYRPFGQEAAAADVIVYKDPQCGCCGKWVEHLRNSGFTVKTYDELRLDKIKSANGLPIELGACHTALVGGYVVEGHVPADTIKRLLRERPAIKGIAVAGMPAGSPGMESAHPQPYNVMSFDATGKVEVYERH